MRLGTVMGYPIPGSSQSVGVSERLGALQGRFRTGANRPVGSQRRASVPPGIGDPGVPQMKMKSLVLLAMAIGCGLVAMLGVQQVFSGDKKPRSRRLRCSWPSRTSCRESHWTTRTSYSRNGPKTKFRRARSPRPNNTKNVHYGSPPSPTTNHAGEVEREGSLRRIERDSQRHAGGDGPRHGHQDPQRLDPAGGPGRRRGDLHHAQDHGRADEQPDRRNPQGQDDPAIHRSLRHGQHSRECRSERGEQGDRRQEHFAVGDSRINTTC